MEAQRDAEKTSWASGKSLNVITRVMEDIPGFYFNKGIS